MFKKIFFALFIFGMFSFAFAQNNDNKKFVGTWKGTMDVGQVINVIFIIQEKDGKLEGTGESPEQGSQAAPLDNIVITGNKIQFDIQAVSASYEGNLKADNKSIEGVLVMRDQTYPLNLTKDAPASVPATKIEINYDSYWETSIQAGEKNLRLIIKFFTKEDKTTGAFMDSPDQGASNIPLSSASITEDSLKFGMAQLHISFEGKIDKATMTASGTFTQGTATLPLVFKKTEKPSNTK